ncbi:NINE protein [Acinetobacter shaoyimingii]|nr:NINE protein [Acinetobacter shaoyimingii]
MPYILLALFLGGFGAHKFYAGKNRLRYSLFNFLLDVYSINFCFY